MQCNHCDQHFALKIMDFCYHHLIKTSCKSRLFSCIINTHHLLDIGSRDPACLEWMIFLKVGYVIVFLEGINESMILLVKKIEA